jgi:hypothetical protein
MEAGNSMTSKESKPAGILKPALMYSTTQYER